MEIDLLPKKISCKIQVCDRTGCWIFKGKDPSSNGYERCWHWGSRWQAHRLVYELLIKKDIRDLHLDHKCKNVKCCNPNHLDPVTPQVNYIRKYKRTKKQQAGNMITNFTMQELTHTMTGLDNTPNEQQKHNLVLVMENMEKVRVVCGNRPIIISSGFRSPEVNKAVRGSEKSAHLQGHAVDFTVKGLSVVDACKLIYESKLNWDQLIHEVAGATEWIHMSFAPEMRRQWLILHR